MGTQKGFSLGRSCPPSGLMRAKSANAARSRELAGSPPSSGPAGPPSVFALRAACGGCASTRACGRSPEGEGSDCRKRCAYPLAPSARGLQPQRVGERTVRQPEIFRAMARFSPSAPTGHLPRRGRFFDTLKPPFDKGGFFFLAYFFIFFALLEHFSIVLHKLVAFTVPIIL